MGNQQADAFVAEGREAGFGHLGRVEPCCCYEDGDGEGEIEFHTDCSPLIIVRESCFELESFPQSFKC